MEGEMRRVGAGGAENRGAGGRLVCERQRGKAANT